MRTKIITTSSDASKCYNLERSLKYFGYDYYFIIHSWGGFLDKIHETYKYLKTLQDYTHFLYSDAWDTIALGGPEETQKFMPDGLMISGERACYPHGDKAVLYPEHLSPYKYVNGGGWCGEISAFIKMYELCPPTTELNDQVYLTDQFLKHYKDGWMKLDYECNMFQTMAFRSPEHFRLIYTQKNGGFRMANNFFNNLPIWFHGNGHENIDDVYKLLP